MGPSGTSNHPGLHDNEPHTGDNRISAGQSAVPDTLQRLAALIAGSPHNLVARGDRADVYERHLVECDALASTLTPAGQWMDLGTGGGLPGLVLALRHPEVRWTLVDATAKKVGEVRSFADQLGLGNVDAVQGRAETLAHDRAYRGRFNGVVSRALAPLPTLVELCRGFVPTNGLIVAVKGPTWRSELAAATMAFRRLGIAVVSTVRLEASVRATWVVTMRATGAPPAGYPRRDGVPKADPIR